MLLLTELVPPKDIVMLPPEPPWEIFANNCSVTVTGTTTVALALTKVESAPLLEAKASIATRPAITERTIGMMNRSLFNHCLHPSDVQHIKTKKTFFTLCFMLRPLHIFCNIN